MDVGVGIEEFASAEVLGHAVRSAVERRTTTATETVQGSQLLLRGIYNYICRAVHIRIVMCDPMVFNILIFVLNYTLYVVQPLHGCFNTDLKLPTPSDFSIVSWR